MKILLFGQQKHKYCAMAFLMSMSVSSFLLLVSIVQPRRGKGRVHINFDKWRTFIIFYCGYM